MPFPLSVPSIPRQLRAEALSPTSIRLYWLQPVPSNGAYVYLLNFTSQHEQIPDTDEIQLNSSLTEFVVEELEEHVEYEFYLQAKTSAGIGEHAVVSETTLEAGKLTYMHCSSELHNYVMQPTNALPQDSDMLLHCTMLPLYWYNS